MLIDSISIILLTVLIFSSLALAMGCDPISFAIFGILIIKAGLLSPPFGPLVYTVRGSVPYPTKTLKKIFIGRLHISYYFWSPLFLFWRFLYSQHCYQRLLCDF